MKKIMLITFVLFICLSVKAQVLDSLNFIKQPFTLKQDAKAVEVDSISYCDCVKTELSEIDSKLDKLVEYKEDEQDIRYKLFPTTNMWTFIRLDTRTGKMWQVQYDTGDDQGVWILNSSDLTAYYDESINGRFTLYPTQNMYNFMLLDQINGNVWQVQWSTKEASRGIVYTF